MTEASTAGEGSLRASVLDLLDRLDPAGIRLVEGLFSGGQLDVPIAVDEGAVIAAVQPYSWLLNRIGLDGVALTSAGYLPPEVVEQTVAALQLGRDWIGKGNREFHTRPVLALRESTQQIGLTRKHRGRLLLTPRGRALASDPTGLWTHLSAHTPATKRDLERDAGQLLLLAVAAGTPLNWNVMRDFLRTGMTSLGWQNRSGTPIGPDQAFSAARDTYQTLRRLRALHKLPYDGLPQAPPDAGIAFARAAIRD